MSITIKDILGFVPADKQAVAKDFLEGLQGTIPINAETFKAFGMDVLNKSTADVFFKEYANKPENLQTVNSLFDSRLSQSMKTYEKTFMEKKFPDILKSEIEKRFPAETQEQIALKEMEMKVDNLTKESLKKDLLIVAKDQIKDLWPGLDPSFLLGDTEAETIQNCENFKKGATTWKDDAVLAKDKEWLERSGQPLESGNGQDVTFGSYEESTIGQRNEYFKKFGNDKFQKWMNDSNP